MGVYFPLGAAAQQASSGGAIIDTVIVVVENVFTDEEARSSFLSSAMNRFRFPTRPGVVQAQLLFEPGNAFDSTEVAESTLRLRELSIFQEVAIDSVRIRGRLAVTVRVRDSWSTSPKFSISTGAGTTTGAIGVTETNLLGTGNLVHFGWTKEVDRNSTDLSGKFDRVIGDVDIDGMVRLQSDGRIADWRIGSPFRSGKDGASVLWESEIADQRVLQFRAAAGVPLDTTIFQRGAALARISAVHAPFATAGEFVRVGAKVQIRQERYVLQTVADQMDVPDTVTAAVGASVEWRRSRFRTFRFFNGFGPEGIDLSHRISLTAWVAPSVLGYDRAGIGPEISLQTAGSLPFGFIAGALTANGLFTGDGLDSGQVEVSLTAGMKPATRHATALHVRAGALESTQPGREFDLGFDTAPRSWEPHAFVGTRMIWGVLEHRWFIFDNLLNLLGLGAAGFLDYGGAWYPDQPRRFGGNVGVGLRFGSAVGALPRTGRVDLGYRFGDGVTDKRWVVSLGAGFVFGASGDPTCVPQIYEVADICRSRR
ncbi:MAG: hypothetical protein O7I93_12935 [Gemmatimonadetes bacterium]|nr:hypothetical protein [Gemmatimonadota bacterium]